jgi:LacI family transcriptional regulator
VINNHPDVADITREQVQKVIDELGYHPSAVARSLTTRRTHTIAVVTAGLNLAGPSRVLHGLALRAEEAGYALLLKNLPSFRVDDYEGLIRYYNEMQVEGVAWAVPDTDHQRLETVEKFSSLPMPVVYQGSAPIEGALYVTVDNYDGGCRATQHLIDQGYRHIAHISGPLSFWDAEARKSGWHDTLEKNGHHPTDTHWSEGDWNSASGAEAVSRLLGTYPNMDAIFAGNDQMAIGAIEKLHEQGLQVPEDIAVIGYDNIAESAYNSPPLTTMSQDFHLMGARTIEVLLEAINAQHTGKKPNTVAPVMLATDLIVRRSSIRTQ